jgi:nucleoid-associated protein YgaU
LRVASNIIPPQPGKNLSPKLYPSDKSPCVLGPERPFTRESFQKEFAVKFTIPAMVISLLLAAGCQQQAKPTTSADSATLNVAPMSAPVAYNSPAPVQTMAPDPALASPSPSANAGSAASANNYTVKKGDTLWKIASVHYGDGKKWHEIADANPGLSPSALRVGMTISLP